MSWKVIAITVAAVVVALFIYDFVSAKLGMFEEEGA